MTKTEKKAENAAKKILKQSKYSPKIGLILGSGLGALADTMTKAEKYPYDKIPNFPTSTVAGHAGQLVVGELEGQAAVAMQGRFHFYEGYKASRITFPVRVMRKLGVNTLLVTNAAGAVNKDYSPGDLMLISDHLNMQGTNPLIGKNQKSFGPRFPDMSTAYSPELRKLARETAAENNISLQEGIYACMPGPSYETPAEIRMLRTLGADAIGMSTVPEVIVAVHSGMQVLGVSCITNMAAGVLDQPLSHDEVLETSERVRSVFLQLMKSIIGKLPAGE